MTLENFLAIGDKYKEIGSLKRLVIAPAVEQINTNLENVSAKYAGYS
ncbi:hypothetical protein [Snodgrassella alvi]|nr:hypothetical protein [Snodgrassella alvi]